MLYNIASTRATLKDTFKRRDTFKLVSAVILTNFYFSPNDSPLKTMKNVLFHRKSSFRS